MLNSMPRRSDALASVLAVLFGTFAPNSVFAQQPSTNSKAEEQEIVPGEACPSSFDRLVFALKSEEPMTRVAAAECLGTLEDKRAVEPLVNAIFAEKYPRFVQAYENALSTINDPHTAELLLAALKSPKTRWKAGYSLGRLQIGSAVDPLLTLLKSNDVEDRRIAATSLGPIKGNNIVT